MLSLAAPLMILDKSRLMTAPGFPFTLPHLTFLIHTLRHNTKITFIHRRHLLNVTVTHHSAMWLAEVVQKSKMSHTSTSISSKAGPKSLSRILSLFTS